MLKSFLLSVSTGKFTVELVESSTAASDTPAAEVSGSFPDGDAASALHYLFGDLLEALEAEANGQIKAADFYLKEAHATIQTACKSLNQRPSNTGSDGSENLRKVPVFAVLRDIYLAAHLAVALSEHGIGKERRKVHYQWAKTCLDQLRDLSVSAQTPDWVDQAEFASDLDWSKTLSGTEAIDFSIATSELWRSRSKPGRACAQEYADAWAFNALDRVLSAEQLDNRNPENKIAQRSNREAFKRRFERLDKLRGHNPEIWEIYDELGLSLLGFAACSAALDQNEDMSCAAVDALAVNPQSTEAQNVFNSVDERLKSMSAELEKVEAQIRLNPNATLSPEGAALKNDLRRAINALKGKPGKFVAIPSSKDIETATADFIWRRAVIAERDWTVDAKCRKSSLFRALPDLLSSDGQPKSTEGIREVLDAEPKLRDLEKREIPGALTRIVSGEVPNTSRPDDISDGARDLFAGLVEFETPKQAKQQTIPAGRWLKSPQSHPARLSFVAGFAAFVIASAVGGHDYWASQERNTLLDGVLSAAASGDLESISALSAKFNAARVPFLQSQDQIDNMNDVVENINEAAKEAPLHSDRSDALTALEQSIINGDSIAAQSHVEKFKSLMTPNVVDARLSQVDTLAKIAGDLPARAIRDQVVHDAVAAMKNNQAKVVGKAVETFVDHLPPDLIDPRKAAMLRLDVLATERTHRLVRDNALGELEVALTNNESAAALQAMDVFFDHIVLGVPDDRAAKLLDQAEETYLSWLTVEFDADREEHAQHALAWGETISQAEQIVDKQREHRN
ncbi:MAG: hypothetical protein ABJJ69_14110 [Paracoccaceae bacterium]